MQAQVTKYYYQWLDDGGTVPPLLTKFPTLKLGNTTLNMSDLFYVRNKYKEIGAETDELFAQNFRNVVNEALILYYDKIENQINNIKKLMDRTVKETYEDRHTNYLQPINETEPKLDDFNKDHGERDRTFGYFKSNPEIMESVNKLEIMYMSALEYMDRIFLGVL